MSYQNGGMFQSIQGPTDANRPHTLTEGYQPVSRIGEIVINAFIDAYEYAQLPEQLMETDFISDPGGGLALTGTTVAEHKPYFHEWATALPGHICLARKARNATFRNYVAAETASPVITCAACLKEDDAYNFYFAGICRSKSVRPIDDGVGPSVDEYFTLSIGGMATLLNNSKNPVFPGDMLEWCLYSEEAKKSGSNLRLKKDPRRVGIQLASPSSERVIGRVLSFAKSGETFDLLIKAC